MRFHLGGIPEPKDFVPDETWKSLREPGPWLMQVFALPLGFVTFVLVGFLWLLTTNLELGVLDSPGFLALGLASFIPLIVLHELIHAMIHPRRGKSDRSILGFWPSRLLFYAHYDGELTRNRFVAILAMPMLVITFAPLTFATITGRSTALVAWVSTWNAFFACGDLFGIILILLQVPRRAKCHNQGWRTYWKV
jgi:hypothetical protein